MKKRLLILLLLAALAATFLTSCNNEAAPETKNTEQGAVTEEQGGSETTDLPTETQASTEADTENQTDPETVPETNENDSFNLENDDAIPYKLLQMTFAEIEEEYGTMGYQCMRDGGTPVFRAKNLPDIDIDFIKASAILTDDMHIETSEVWMGDLVIGLPMAAPGDIPTNIRIYSEDYSVYPGVRNGMSAEEVKAVLPEWNMDKVNYIAMLDRTLLDLFAFINDCTIKMTFRISDDYINEIFDGVSRDNYPNSDSYEAVVNECSKEVIAKFSENPQGKLESITVTRDY